MQRGLAQTHHESHQLIEPINRRDENGLFVILVGHSGWHTRDFDLEQTTEC